MEWLGGLIKKYLYILHGSDKRITGAIKTVVKLHFTSYMVPIKDGGDHPVVKWVLSLHPTWFR